MMTADIGRTESEQSGSIFNLYAPPAGCDDVFATQLLEHALQLRTGNTDQTGQILLFDGNGAIHRFHVFQIQVQNIANAYKRGRICMVHILIEQIADELTVLFQYLRSHLPVLHTHAAKYRIGKAAHLHIRKRAQHHLIIDQVFMRNNAQRKNRLRAEEIHGFEIAAGMGQRKMDNPRMNIVRRIVDYSMRCQQFIFFVYAALCAVALQLAFHIFHKTR